MLEVGDGSPSPGAFFLGWKEVKAGCILRWEHESVRVSIWPRSPFTVAAKLTVTLTTVAGAPFASFLPPC